MRPHQQQCRDGEQQGRQYQDERSHMKLHGDYNRRQRRKSVENS
jgi:hypothetical protein